LINAIGLRREDVSRNEAGRKGIARRFLLRDPRQKKKLGRICG
jgi:hypothetical protein